MAEYISILMIPDLCKLTVLEVLLLQLNNLYQILFLIILLQDMPLIVDLLEVKYSILKKIKILKLKLYKLRLEELRLRNVLSVHAEWLSAN